MEHAKRKKVRQHPAHLRQQVLRECAQLGASVAAVALAHGLNANLVHAWRQQERDKVAQQGQSSVGAPAQFVALQLPPPTAGSSAAPDIRIELRRGATSVSIVWPGQAAHSCGAWLREWLQ